MRLIVMTTVVVMLSLKERYDAGDSLLDKKLLLSFK